MLSGLTLQMDLFLFQCLLTLCEVSFCCPSGDTKMQIYFTQFDPSYLAFFVLFQQDMQVSGVEDDSRALNIVIHKPSSNPHAKPLPILQANFIFADHIRCIIAKQRLAKGRIQARRMKMQRIAG